MLVLVLLLRRPPRPAHDQTRCDDARSGSDAVRSVCVRDGGGGGGGVPHHQTRYMVYGIRRVRFPVSCAGSSRNLSYEGHARARALTSRALYLSPRRDHVVTVVIGMDDLNILEAKPI